MNRPRFALVALLGFLLILLTALHAAAQTIDPKQVQAIEARIAELRQLTPEVDVPVAAVPRQEFVARSQAQATTLEAQAEITTTQKLLRLLGLIPAGLDLAREQVEVAGVQVLGTYSAEDKQIAVVDDGELDAQAKVTLAHELTHALQDQHFDLAALTSQEPRNSDRDLAIQALVEGDATLTARIFATLSLSGAELRELASPADPQALQAPDGPEALREELRFVYLGGANFVQDLLADGGWEAVNAAYQRPPQSTEQVLHPDRYLVHEAPSIPSLGNATQALGPEWGLLREDTLGELDLQLTFRQFLPFFIATQAAAGWGGDRYQLLERRDDGFLALVLTTTWDSSRDAQEFFMAYADLVAARYRGAAIPRQDQPRLRVWSTPDGVIWLQGDEARVVLAIGPELRHAQALAGLAGR
ncbi:MAG: hypothetical protein HY690_13685 [Chloroflexi bacterium]|nr:hypothetical protein [Chloroflexota bacterium]